MATYSWWDTTSPTVNSGLSGNNVCGLEFIVTSTCAVTQYKVYRYSSSIPSTSATFTAAIYQVSNTTQVPGSLTTLGTIPSTNGWKHFDVSPVVPLAANTRYKLVMVTNAMPYQGGVWSGSSGRTSGPLTLYGTSNATSGIQGTITAGGSSMGYPTADSGSGGRNWGMDLVIDDTLGGATGAGSSRGFLPFFGPF